MKKRITIFIIALTVILSNLSVFAASDLIIGKNASAFTDISGHWAQSAIETYADPDIFADGEGSFLPGKAITRLEFAIILHTALDIKIKYLKEPDIKEFFDDVSNEDIGSSQLYDLAAAGIIDRKNSFGPNEVLPRDEMVHYIINALKDMTGGNYAIILMMPEPFDDDSKISPEYKNDITEAMLLKLIYGRGRNMFYPDSPATRAEGAIVVQRLANTAASFKEDVDVVPSVEVSDSGLTMKLSIANHSGKPVTINHSSGQKYDFTLMDSDRNIIYRWSADKSFIAALTTTVIEDGDTLEFSSVLEGADYSVIKNSIKYMAAYITGQSHDFEINMEGYELGIRQPQRLNINPCK
ncbi:S-layer family protein [Anaerobacterium chartisolvens]|uniref:S-layer family protein n=1 Tax=Anaerobacterium chartisolvens TaxID=1297424 RepID=A0A369AVU4_9FIRM|nr:BsuPI-related putative proteinase inhibitor [Anaerobacterium chartisolvens]RCX13185.1 S-layer family protein [Anaerobacterium chartisolvens]